MSDIGGLAGLFLGISLLSLFELVLKAIAISRNFINKLRCLKGKNKKKHRKWGNREKKRARKRIKRNQVTPEIVIVDLVFGEEIKARK